MENKPEKMLYTVKEAGAVLGVNSGMVRKLIKKGLLPGLKLGCLKVRKTSLEKFIKDYDGMNLDDLDNITPLILSEEREAKQLLFFYYF